MVKTSLKPIFFKMSVFQYVEMRETSVNKMNTEIIIRIICTVTLCLHKYMEEVVYKYYFLIIIFIFLPSIVIFLDVSLNLSSEIESELNSPFSVVIVI